MQAIYRGHKCPVRASSQRAPFRGRSVDARGRVAPVDVADKTAIISERPMSVGSPRQQTKSDPWFSSVKLAGVSPLFSIVTHHNHHSRQRNGDSRPPLANNKPSPSASGGCEPAVSVNCQPVNPLLLILLNRRPIRETGDSHPPLANNRPIPIGERRVSARCFRQPVNPLLLLLLIADRYVKQGFRIPRSPTIDPSPSASGGCQPAVSVNLSTHCSPVLNRQPMHENRGLTPPARLCGHLAWQYFFTEFSLSHLRTTTGEGGKQPETFSVAYRR